MAATKKKEKKSGNEDTTALAVKDTTSDVVVFEGYEEMAGEGQENVTAADKKVAWIEVFNEKNKRMKSIGEQPGRLYDSVSEEAFDSTLFVPCWSRRQYVEWKPREQGGGIEGRHDPNSEVGIWAQKQAAFGKLKMENGNDLIETFYLFGLRCEGSDPTTPGVLTFTSSKIGTYQAFQTRVGALLVNTPAGKKNPPTYAHLIRISSEEVPNSVHGDFFIYAIDHVRLDEATGEYETCKPIECLMPVKDDRLLQGRKLYQAMRAGTKDVDYDQQEAASATATGEEAEDIGPITDGSIPF